jgi:hypothetical protein
LLLDLFSALPDIAWAVIDRHGNRVTDPKKGGHGRIDFPRRGASSGGEPWQDAAIGLL